jgi:hypothetical protein
MTCIVPYLGGRFAPTSFFFLFSPIRSTMRVRIKLSIKLLSDLLEVENDLHPTSLLP